MADTREDLSEKQLQDEGVILEDFPINIIYRDGRVYGIKSKREVKFNKSPDGFLCASLTRRKDSGSKRSTMGLHTLLGMAFIPNPENLRFVTHKDGNKLNNSLDNLEWSDLKSINRKKREKEDHAKKGTRPVIQYSQSMEFIRRYDSIVEAAEEMDCHPSLIRNVCRRQPGKNTAKGFIWRYETEKEEFNQEEDEAYKIIPGYEDYKISSKGRIYSMKTKRYLSIMNRKDGYQRVQVGNKHEYVHVLMAHAFFGPPSKTETYEVNHKDGNKSNNIIENLEWMTHQENVQHAHDTGLNKPTRSVVQYSLEGHILNRYGSVADAAKAISKDHSRKALMAAHTCISNVCKKKKFCYTAYEYIWRYEGNHLTVKELENVKTSKTPVDQYTLDCEFVRTYSSIKEAEDETGIERSNISHALNPDGDCKTGGGFMWRRHGEPAPEKKVRTGKRKVAQLSLETGEIIKIWDSAMDAERGLGKKINSHISQVCKGNGRKSAGGFGWKHID